ncbi:Platelet-activating factor acetylhydrolase IB subunit gamma [Orchesella cincta]|uniref:Platelet-activating factor acetylhydrolase IB subunit gamma n=1 Tax=Orchesella cincta TaxID=48709 RepID=A0A1D2NDA8_ORCCI|nr:Platelet-activating factor acetylhydrolase IB subunit gamma [Orchesella cincta]
MEVFVFSLFISLGQLKPLEAPKYNKNGQVVFLGDSITDGWRGDGSAVWSQYYEKLGAVNTGVGGWTTRNIIEDINNGKIDNLNAYLAVLKIGTNDLAWAGISEAEVIANTGIILDMISAKNPGVRILLLGILPRGEVDIHEKIRRVNQATQAFADNSRVFFLNMEEQFSTGLGQVREELFTPDKLHLGPQGYVVWAQTMESLFNNVLNAAFPSKVVWMGDSLSSQWLSTGLSIWDATYKPIETRNFAVSGHTSDDTIQLIEGQNVLEGLNPKAVVLLIGGNDLQRGAQAPQVIANIERILQHFKNRFAHARILLLGLLPAGGVPDSVIEQGKLINDALAAKHNGDDLRYLDMRNQFADANEEIFRELYQPDGIHLTLQGYNLKEIFVFFLVISLGQLKPLDAPKYNKNGQVVFLGDSITDWWRSEGKATWDQYYEPLGAVNTGVAGDTTTDVINRINGGMIDNLNAYLAVLKIGTNDLARGVSEADTVTNTGRILDMISAKNPGVKIILLGILPRGDSGLHEKIRRVNQATNQAYTDNSRVFFLDMEEQFSTGLGQVRQELFWDDKLHLSAQGYVAWAQTMESVFNNVLNAPFPAKVVWMGDSLSSQWLSTGLSIWDATYKPIETRNFAVSGHTSDDTIQLIEGQNVLEGLNPKAVVLLIGGNDLQRGAQAPQVIANIERILQHFKNRFPHARILLLGLLPAGGVPDSVIEQGKLINDALAAKHNGDDLRYLDMRNQFADANEEIFKELYQPDGIHLTLTGYNVWNNAMLSHLTPLLQFN